MERRWTMQSRDLQVAWAAGFLDGEGCFHLQGKCCPSITASQREKSGLERLQDIFGGNIIPTRKIYWRWGLFGDNAVVACEELMPYLDAAKRIQARTLLTLRKNCNLVEPHDMRFGKRRVLGSDQLKLREWYHKTIKALKRPVTA